MRIPHFLRPLALSLALVPFALPAQTAHLQFQGGSSFMDGRGATALFIEGVFNAHRLGDSGWRIAPYVSLGWIDGRDIARFRGSRYGTRTAGALLLAAGARIHYGDADDGATTGS
ncbi:hypothetical protein [Rhodanobacter lindaniclasticus]